ncbi:MAG TPA: nucleotidyltransferase domain-containing protein [Candidatus Nanoarchaeia archaeon]|nr:nucleotidyltransferase domain-containing protein [Candidatus Nanoarchaeia archaeon]
MLQKNNRYKLLKIFLFNPTEEFRLRELSRLSKISPPSVMAYLKEFEREELIKSFKKRGVPFYKSEIDSEKFREYKKISILFELNDSGLTNFLWDELSPKAIILYGSFAKGESLEESDIDLFVIGKERKIKLEEFEKKLGRKIHLMFDDNPKNIPNELKNNLVNGIVLKGYLKLF